jgi:hypothetical protein
MLRERACDPDQPGIVLEKLLTNFLQEYISGCPYHEMEDWLLKQGFYHRLTQRNREQLDATTRESFMSLTLSRAETLMDKIAENQSWKQDNMQHSRQIEEA